MINLDLGPGYLPPFIPEMLANAAVRPEGGVHDFLFDFARVLHAWRNEDWVDSILHQYAAQCGRHVPETEIAASIRRSKPYAWNRQTHSDTGAATPRPYVPIPKPQFDPEAFSRFIVGIGNVDAEWLAARSPVLSASSRWPAR